jgi:hypothetical protein
MAGFILRACFYCGSLPIVSNILGSPRVHDHFNPAQERWREALCTLGDGYFATRVGVRRVSLSDPTTMRCAVCLVSSMINCTSHTVTPCDPDVSAIVQASSGWPPRLWRHSPLDFNGLGEWIEAGFPWCYGNRFTSHLRETSPASSSH